MLRASEIKLVHVACLDLKIAIEHRQAGWRHGKIEDSNEMSWGAYCRGLINVKESRARPSTVNATLYSRDANFVRQ